MLCIIKMYLTKEYNDNNIQNNLLKYAYYKHLQKNVYTIIYNGVLFIIKLSLIYNVTITVIIHSFLSTQHMTARTFHFIFIKQNKYVFISVC
jgi:hypothetical protein